MSWWTHDCNQGHECPARVAKIGRRDYAKEPYPPSPAPRCLKQLAKWVLICIAAAFFVILTLVVSHA